MNTGEVVSGPDERDILEKFPGIHRCIREILELGEQPIDVDVIQGIGKKLQAMIVLMRKCLHSLEGVEHISTVFNQFMTEIDSMQRVRSIYGFTCLSLEEFNSLPLEGQLTYLIARERQNDESAVCHHWTLFWYHFWTHCVHGTIFEDKVIHLCQRTNNKTEMNFGQHTFLLLDIGRRYVLSIDGKTGISMREAKNFSEVDGKIFRTINRGKGHDLETIRIFPDDQTFAQQLESLGDKRASILDIIFSPKEGDKDV